MTRVTVTDVRLAFERFASEAHRYLGPNECYYLQEGTAYCAYRLYVRRPDSTGLFQSRFPELLGSTAREANHTLHVMADTLMIAHTHPVNRS